MSVKALATKAAYRKASGIPFRLLGRALRLVSAEQSFASAPPVLANSFPKSGTHLLLQILQAFPRTRYFYNFVASAPAHPNTERSLEFQLALLDKVVPREVVPAHLYFNAEICRFIAERGMVHYFIYRDPRDICVSEAEYLTKFALHHSLHAVFADECRNDDDRISLAIKGLASPRPTADYPDVAARFGRFRGWLERDDVCAIRFEDLRGESLRSAVQRMLQFYRDRTQYDFELEAAVERAILSIRSHRSHTFRRGEVGEWRERFTEPHKKLVKDLAGSLLIDLGYETDMDW